VVFAVRFPVDADSRSAFFATEKSQLGRSARIADGLLCILDLRIRPQIIRGDGRVSPRQLLPAPRSIARGMKIVVQSTDMPRFARTKHGRRAAATIGIRLQQQAPVIGD